MKSPRNIRNSAGGGVAGTTDGTEVAMDVGVPSLSESLFEVLEEVRSGSVSRTPTFLAAEGQRYFASKSNPLMRRPWRGR